MLHKLFLRKTDFLEKREIEKNHKKREDFLKYGYDEHLSRTAWRVKLTYFLYILAAALICAVCFFGLLRKTAAVRANDIPMAFISHPYDVQLKEGKLTFDIPLGWKYLLKVSENEILFSALNSVLALIVTMTLSDVLQVRWSWRRDFNYGDLWWSRAAASVFYLPSGLLSSPIANVKPSLYFKRRRVDPGLGYGIYWLHISLFTFFFVQLASVAIPEYAKQGRKFNIAKGERYNLKPFIEPRIDVNWPGFGFRKCSLINVCRENSDKQDIPVNTIMACGTYVTRDVDFDLLTSGDITAEVTGSDDATGQGNLMLVARSGTLTGRHLITLNPALRRSGEDVQIDFNSSQHGIDQLNSNISTWLNNLRLSRGRQNGQYVDWPVVELLKALTQNVIANSGYRLVQTDSLTDGQMSLGEGIDRTTYTLCALLVIAILGVLKILMWWVYNGDNTRQLEEVTDIALMGLTADMCSASIYEASEYRLAPVLDGGMKLVEVSEGDNPGVRHRRVIAYRPDVPGRPTREQWDCARPKCLIALDDTVEVAGASYRDSISHEKRE